MNSTLAGIAARIAELERELERELEVEVARSRRRFRYRVEKGRIAFESETAALHDALRQGVLAFLWSAPPLSLLVAPVIYSLIVPLAALDAWVTLYQAVCFPIYGIAKAERALFIVCDRGGLRYLNWIERLNCDYCAYANGVVAYAREVAARTEQYFCPIKNARSRAGAHERYRDFLDFGDAAGFQDRLAALRANIRKAP